MKKLFYWFASADYPIRYHPEYGYGYNRGALYGFIIGVLITYAFIKLI